MFWGLIAEKLQATSTNNMIIFIFFILGLVIGSFLNVIVYRLSLAETILGRSHCPHCRTKIKWYDNIPLISFALLKAKCRDCGERISWQYPLVEFLIGVIFAVTANLFFKEIDFNSFLITIFYLGIFSILMTIFLYDLRFMEIPMVMFWIGLIWIGLFLIVFYQIGLFASEIPLISALTGGIISFAFFFSLAYFSKEKWMGLGDGYVGLLAGFTVGWPNILLTLFLSFIIGTIISLFLMSLRKKSMKSQIPFAPFLVTGTILTIFLKEIYPGILVLLGIN